MIKFNSITRLARFSNIVFPQNYQMTFKISHDIRSCLNLTELSQYINKNDELIQKYAKTPILEYLNEIPLHFNMKSLDTPLQVYFYVLTLKDLNMYEQQLRLSNLIKLSIYSGYDSRKLSDMMIQQQKHLQSKTKETPFDLVDAINWLVMRKNMKGSQLTAHALDVVCNTHIDQYSGSFSKLVNMLLKKFDDLEWIQIRGYRAIFEYLCHKFQEHREGLPIRISNGCKMAVFQFHRLGYDTIPKAIPQLFSSLQTQLHKIDLRNLETAYSILKYIPYGTLPLSTYTSLFSALQSQLQNHHPFIQDLPLHCLSKSQFDKITQIYTQKWIFMANASFSFNRPQMNIALLQPKIMQKYYQRFIEANQKKGLLIANINSYIVAVYKLVLFFRYDQSKVDTVIDKFRKQYYHYISKFNQVELILKTSLCSLFQLMWLEEQYGITKNKAEFRKGVDLELQIFTAKSLTTQIKVKRSFTQIYEMIIQFKNTKSLQILRKIDFIVRKVIQHHQQFKLDDLAKILFQFTDCSNSYQLQQTTQLIYQKLKGIDLIGIAQEYIKFQDKNRELTSIILMKLYNKSKDFKVVGKIVAHIQLVYFQGYGGSLISHVGNLLRGIEVLTKQDIDIFSTGQMTSLLRFCHYFYDDLEMFSVRMIELVWQKIQNQTGGKSKEDKSNQLRWKLFQVVKQINKKDVNNKFIQQLLQQMGQKIRRQNYAEFADEKILEENINKGLYVSKSYQQLINILSLIVSEEIVLEQKGCLCFLQQIQHKISNQEIKAADIKLFVEEYLSEKAMNKQVLFILESILTFTLKSIKVQQGPQFNIFCLKVAHKANSTHLIQLVIPQLCVHILQEHLIVKILSYITKFPKTTYQPLTDHLINCVRMKLPSKSQTYIPLLHYLALVYDNKLPQKHQVEFKQMLELSCKKMMSTRSKIKGQPKSTIKEFYLNVFTLYNLIQQLKCQNTQSQLIKTFKSTYMSTDYTQIQKMIENNQFPQLTLNQLNQQQQAEDKE